MNRRSFVTTAAGAAVASIPTSSYAQLMAAKMTTQQALFDVLPRPKPGQWVRLIMGSGVDYQKQIGLGTESTGAGNLFYVETQIGTPGGSCNPNTMKRVYLTRPHFGSLLGQDPVLANVANSGTTLTRWGDIGGGQTQTPSDARLRFFDASYLYDDRPIHIVATSSETLKLASRNAYGGSGDSGRGRLSAQKVTHIVAEFAPPFDAKHKLTRIELWTTPDVPFGVAKYRALSKDQDPFEMHLYSYGVAFKPDLNMSLSTVRAITPDGTHIQTS